MLSFSQQSPKMIALPSCSGVRQRITRPGRFVHANGIPPGLDKLNASEGNPIVYRGAIERVQGQPSDGAPVVLTDWKDCAIAWGIYNGTSMFACRVLQLDREVRADPSVVLDIRGVLRQAIQQAGALRARLGLPSDSTDVFRLVNSEGDGISGLTVDILGRQAVAMASSAWVLQHTECIEQAVMQATGVKRVIWRTDEAMMQLEGLSKEEVSRLCGSSDETPSAGEAFIVKEEGIKFLVDPVRSFLRSLLVHDPLAPVDSSLGQKTGFYVDQRDNRLYLRSCVQPTSSVLDLCCYTGPFALNAAVAGAESVVGVDSSAAAIDIAKRNAELNGVTDRCEFIASSIERFMETAHQEGKQWDIVVLDPPKLAPNKKILDRAMGKYKSLNEAAIRLVKPGGLLMTCSCSAAMTQSEHFVPTIVSAARKSRRQVTIIRSAGAATDHVMSPSYSLGRYLTNVLVSVK